MKEPNVWKVDQVAASALAKSLSIEVDDQRLEQLARHFARHRFNSCSWIVEQVLTNLVSKLEAAARQAFAQKDESWADGYSFAEHVVATMPPGELLDIDGGPGPTKGQVLRRLVRSARNRTQQ